MWPPGGRDRSHLHPPELGRGRGAPSLRVSEVCHYLLGRWVIPLRGLGPWFSCPRPASPRLPGRFSFSGSTGQGGRMSPLFPRGSHSGIGFVFFFYRHIPFHVSCSLAQRTPPIYTLFRSGRNLYIGSMHSLSRHSGEPSTRIGLDHLAVLMWRKEVKY